jgi:hypothetical protein
MYINFVQTTHNNDMGLVAEFNLPEGIRTGSAKKKNVVREM